MSTQENKDAENNNINSNNLAAPVVSRSRSRSRDKPTSSPRQNIGKIAIERQNVLSRQLASRSQRQNLVDRFIIRDLERSEALFVKQQQLAPLLQNRKTKAALVQLNVIKEDEDPEKLEIKTQEKREKLNRMLEARPTVQSLRKYGVPSTTAPTISQQIKEAHAAIGDQIAHRPTPEKLLELRVMADIGHLPVVDEIKGHHNQLSPQKIIIESTSGDEKINFVSCGWSHTAVFNDRGHMYTFGSSANGRLGIGPSPPPFLAEAQPLKLLQAIGRITNASCGDNHSAAIVAHDLYTWGSGSWGRLGLGDQKDAYSPTPVSLSKPVTQVSCGAYHTLALTKNGEVYAFGWNKNGRAGFPLQKTTILSPEPISSLANIRIVMIQAAQAHSLALSQTGQVFSWGCGQFGVLGHGDFADVFAPKQIQALNEQNIVRIASGSSHSLAASSSGGVYSWGHNKYFQLGHDKVAEKGLPTPLLVDTSGVQADLTQTPVTCLSANKSSSAMIVDGKLYTWGNGSYGMLGHGDEQHQRSPKLVVAFANIRLASVSLGWSHAAVITESDELYTWGNVDQGKLGHL